MAENQIAHDARTDEAATYEPVSPLHPADAGDGPHFASAAAEEAYWKGVAHGIRTAGREPAHPHMPAEFDLDLTRAGEPATLVSSRLLDAYAAEDQILPQLAWGRGTARSAVEGPPTPPCAPAQAGAQYGPQDWTPAFAGEQRDASLARRQPNELFTPDRRRAFLDALAETGVVADACRATGVSRPTPYNLRKRAGGAAFALAWDAAILIARHRVADEALARALHGCIERVYRNGELVAERHRYDNRLTMAVLTRLDRQAEGLGEGAAAARAVAGEWDQFLDIVEAGGEGAGEFLRARTDPPRDGEGDRDAQRRGGGAARPPNRCQPVHQPAVGPPPRAGEELEAAAARLSRLKSYETFGAGLPGEIDTTALDPAAMASWTDAQWARAEASSLLDRLGPADWPQEAQDPPPPRGDGGVDAGSANNANGMCKMRKAFRDRHPPEPDREEDYEGCTVWQGRDGEWRTDFPPPPGFAGWKQGSDPEAIGYMRALTVAEQEAIRPEIEAITGDPRELLRALEAARDRFFGFVPAPFPAHAEPAAALAERTGGR